MTSIRVVPSAELTAAEWSELTDLCIAAFEESWDGYWESIGPGLHVIAEDDEERILAHAGIVDRLLYLGDAVLRAGYLEAVAVLPAFQRRGHGTAVMEVINRLLDEGYELGGLGTGSHHFYEQLGWVTWQGTAWIRQPGGRLDRALDRDGGIMVRRTPTTPPDLDVSLPIAVDWRPDEVW